MKNVMKYSVWLALAMASFASGCGGDYDERELIITDESLEAKGMSAAMDPALPENQYKNLQKQQ